MDSPIAPSPPTPSSCTAKVHSNSSNISNYTQRSLINNSLCLSFAEFPRKEVAQVCCIGRLAQDSSPRRIGQSAARVRAPAVAKHKQHLLVGQPQRDDDHHGTRHDGRNERHESGQRQQQQHCLPRNERKEQRTNATATRGPPAPAATHPGHDHHPRD